MPSFALTYRVGDMYGLVASTADGIFAGRNISCHPSATTHVETNIPRQPLMRQSRTFQDNVVTSMEQWKVVESSKQLLIKWALSGSKAPKAGAWALRSLWQVLCVLCLRTPRGARPRKG